MGTLNSNKMLKQKNTDIFDITLTGIQTVKPL